MLAIDLLKDFLERVKDRYGASEWLNGDDMEVYVRKSVPRYLNGGVRCQTLDIANINVWKPGRGDFTRFLEQAEQLNPFPAIYIENVLPSITPGKEPGVWVYVEARLAGFLERRGYTKHDMVEPPSYYKMNNENVKNTEQVETVSA